MSKSSTSFRVFHPDTNAISALALFDATGASLTPASLVDGTGNPAGYLSKVITFAAGSEPLFATPTFSNPAAPVSIYLTRDEAGDFYQVLDESIFNSRQPRAVRPRRVTAAQEYLLYETLANTPPPAAASGPSRRPPPPSPSSRPSGKDPITGETLEGNDILFRWTGKCPTPDRGRGRRRGHHRPARLRPRGARKRHHLRRIQRRPVPGPVPRPDRARATAWATPSPCGCATTSPATRAPG